MGVWSQNAERLFFSSTRAGGRGIFQRAADGSGDVERLVTIEDSTGLNLWGSPVDGRRLVFHYTDAAGDNVGLLTLDERPLFEPLLDSPANEAYPTVAPNGRWIAYQSNETGDWEVYAERFPAGGERQRISADGGVKPLWSPEGDSLYYVKRNTVMRVSVETEEALSPGAPTVLFEANEPLDARFRGVQAISPDGQRFLALLEQGAAGGAPPSDLVVIQHWFQELERLAPTN